jgi:hypothetical protein
MSHFTCTNMNELAAELSLGIVSGEARAHALAHISACAECRLLVEQMSRAADSLLLLGPQMEPPIGFESRVMARVGRPRRRISWKAVVAAAAFAAVCSTATGIVVNNAADPVRQRAAQYDRLILALGGKTLRAAELRSLDGTAVGKVYAYEGKGKQPSWVFLVLQDREGTGAYEVELQPISGEAIRLAGLQLKAGRASWATTAAIQVDNIQSVNIVDATGAPLYGAEFSNSSSGK